MRQEEKEQTQEPVREQIENVDRSCQSKNSARQEHASGIQLAKMRQQEIHAGSRNTSNKGKEIRGRNHAAFFVRGRAMLDECIHRYSKEAAKNTQRSQCHDCGRKTMR